MIRFKWNDINLQVNKARFVVRPQENPEKMKHVTTNRENRLWTLW